MKRVHLERRLGSIADLSLADRDKALAQLQRLFLVNRIDVDRFWVLPIVQRYIVVEGVKSPEYPILVERWLRWLEAFTQSYGT